MAIPYLITIYELYISSHNFNLKKFHSE